MPSAGLASDPHSQKPPFLCFDLFPFYKEKVLKNNVKSTSHQANKRQKETGNSDWDLQAVDLETFPALDGVCWAQTWAWGSCTLRHLFPHLTNKHFLNPREDPGRSF